MSIYYFYRQNKNYHRSFKMKTLENILWVLFALALVLALAWTIFMTVADEPRAETVVIASMTTIPEKAGCIITGIDGRTFVNTNSYSGFASHPIFKFSENLTRGVAVGDTVTLTVKGPRIQALGLVPWVKNLTR